MIELPVQKLMDYFKEHGLPVAYKQTGPSKITLAYKKEEITGEGWQEPELEPMVHHKGGGNYKVAGLDGQNFKGKDAALEAAREMFRAK